MYYVAGEDAEDASGKRAAHGPDVWRRADRTDALYADCVVPYRYAKAQGEPVKVWGLLAKGVLHCTILPTGEHMNRWWYAWIVKRYFPQ